jgi:hypothetical protein
MGHGARVGRVGLLESRRVQGVDEFGLVKPDHGLGQGIVVAVSPATDGRFYTGESQALGVANGQISNAPVRVMDEAFTFVAQAFGDGLLEGVEPLCQHPVRRFRLEELLNHRAEGE